MTSVASKKRRFDEVMDVQECDSSSAAASSSDEEDSGELGDAKRACYTSPESSDGEEKEDESAQVQQRRVDTVPTMEERSRLFDKLDLAPFYDTFGTDHLKLDRGLARSTFDNWHTYMSILTENRSSPVPEHEKKDETLAQVRIEKLNHTRDRLAAFYEWVYADCPGEFESDRFDCWLARWSRRHAAQPSVLSDDALKVNAALYNDLRIFLMRIEYKFDLRSDVHLTLLVHGILNAWCPSVNNNFESYCKSTARNTGRRPLRQVPLTRLITLPSYAVLTHVWKVYQLFERAPAIQIANFFTFLADNVVSVVLPLIRDLVRAERSAVFSDDDTQHEEVDDTVPEPHYEELY